MKNKSAFAVLLIVCPILAAAAEPLPAQPAKPLVPFIDGLTVVSSISEPAGDYESLTVVSHIDANGYQLNYSAELPNPGGGAPDKLDVSRKVRAADQATAHAMRLYFATGDPAEFPGTVPRFSAAQVLELRQSGKTQVNYQEVTMLFMMSTVQEMKGTVTRLPGPTSAFVLVNGHKVELPVIHVRGQLAADDDTETADIVVLDDPAIPILLSFVLGEAKGATTRIEYPVPKEAASSMESTLAKHEPVLVYGIYFSFARADIRPQSDRVLEEIARVMAAHPDWKLRIDGHTDNIGGNAANLELSKKRSAAVKAALVSRYKIDAARLDTNGYGENSPREKNDSVEHRALNRRVELRRE